MRQRVKARRLAKYWEEMNAQEETVMDAKGNEAPAPFWARPSLSRSA
jgi:hypothetical protein